MGEEMDEATSRELTTARAMRTANWAMGNATEADTTVEAIGWLTIARGHIDRAIAALVEDE